MENTNMIEQVVTFTLHYGDIVYEKIKSYPQDWTRDEILDDLHEEFYDEMEDNLEDDVDNIWYEYSIK